MKDHTGTEPPVFPPERTYADAETNAVISEGRTMGCFYIESPGMRLLLQRLRTRTFRDLTAVSSIIRPGRERVGDDGGLHLAAPGGGAPKYAAPGLEPILRETFGVMVYQEDVIRVAHEFVGLTLGEADLLRRAMSGKYRSRAEMESLTGSFFEKGRARGIGGEVLAELWGQIQSFAGYAFCKAHSASFAQLSYQVAYLKAHHPAEFFAALVNNQGGLLRHGGLRGGGPALGPGDPPARRQRLGGGVRREGRASCAAGSSPCAACAPAPWTPSTRSAARAPTAPSPTSARASQAPPPRGDRVLVRAGACDSFGMTRGICWSSYGPVKA